MDSEPRLLKESDYIFSRFIMMLDLAVSAVSVLIAHGMRNYVIAPYIAPEIFRYRSYFSDYWWLVLILPVLTVLLLKYNGYYQSQRVKPVTASFTAILIACLGASLLAIVISFVFSQRGGQGNFFSQAFKGELVSRGILMLYPLVAVAALFAKSLATHIILYRLRNQGYNTRNMLLVGDPEMAGDFIAHIRRHPHWGFKIVGLVSDSDVKADFATAKVASYSELMTYLENHVVDDVVFTTSHDGLNTLAPMLQGCEEMGVRTRLPVHVFQNRIARPVLDNFDDLPVITFNPVKEFGRALFFKYAFDRIAAILLLVLLFPVMLAIALAIKFTGHREEPVLYGQKRCGLNGRLFTLWKFRSMVVDADKVKPDLKELNEMSGPVFKIKDDPRITSVGRWLRRMSLDELPQLWNVVLGDMSLVGPRPGLPDEVARYDRWQRRRLSMKPGITCIWQVSGRNELSFETWMKLDLEYIDNWTTVLDFKILAKTLWVVLTGRGAM